MYGLGFGFGLGLGLGLGLVLEPRLLVLLLPKALAQVQLLLAVLHARQVVLRLRDVGEMWGWG